MYKCGNCKELIRIDLTLSDIQCEKCGSKVFYKERPNVKKVVHAR